MKRLALVLAVLLTVSLTWLLGQYHFVTAQGRVRIYPKQSWTLAPSFADVDSWTIQDLPAHEDLVEAMIRAGDLRLLPRGEVISNLMDLGAGVAWVLFGIRMSSEFRAMLESGAVIGAGQLMDVLSKLRVPGRQLETSD